MVAMAGASGFVGSNLRRGLGGEFRWLALTRSRRLAEDSETDATMTTWRHCDLFSLPQVRSALEGADYGVYLVHSMLPSSRLVQAGFADLDVLLADNFARAAREAGLRGILYLGGLIPEGGRKLSPHLRSRLEVESVLRQSGIPVTVLRAGLIVGPGGSSTAMLVNLVRRLPVMVLPRWTRSTTQSVDIRDVVRAVGMALREPRFQGGIYDIAGHPPTSYGEMIRQTAAVLGRRHMAIRYPFHSIRISRYWVSCFSGVSPELTHPLLESLTHDLKATPNPLLDAIAPDAVSFGCSLRDAIAPEAKGGDFPRRRILRTDRAAMRAQKRVRSVQRLPLPADWDADATAEEYGRWLTRRYRGLLRVDRGEEGDEGAVRFFVAGLRVPLLVLTPTPFTDSAGLRRAFYITGGLLAKNVDPPGRLEFRAIPGLGCQIAAIHGYAPRLPWPVYRLTQARIHLHIMRAFAAYLRRIPAKKSSPDGVEN